MIDQQGVVIYFDIDCKTNKLTIPKQNVGPVSNGLFAEGSGTYTKDKINYSISYTGTHTDNCTAVMTKQ